MHLATYLLSIAFALASADISFGPPPNNPTYGIPDPLHPTFFPQPLKEARPTHPLTRRHEIAQPTPFSPFPGRLPGNVFVEKHIPISSTDPVALPPAHPSVIVSDTVLAYTASHLTGTIPPPSSPTTQHSDTISGGAYTGYPSPLPTTGLSISSLPTPIIIDNLTPGYSQETGSHSVSQTIVSTLAIPTTPITVVPNPGGPVSTLPNPYTNSTVTTKPATNLTTSTKVTTPPVSGTQLTGTVKSSASPSSSPPPTSVGNVLEWNAALAVTGLMGAFAFGML